MLNLIETQILALIFTLSLTLGFYSGCEKKKSVKVWFAL